MRIPFLNWRKGFNRVFVVLGIGWAVFFPLINPYMAERKDSHEYEVDLENCKKEFERNRRGGEALEAAQNLYALCTETVVKMEALEHKQDPFGHWWDYPSVLVRIGVLVVPPPVAYGLFRLAWFVFAWLQRGFRQPAS